MSEPTEAEKQIQRNALAENRRIRRTMETQAGEIEKLRVRISELKQPVSHQTANEIEAIRSILIELGPLDEGARRRALRYAAEWCEANSPKTDPATERSPDDTLPDFIPDPVPGVSR